MFDFCVRRLRFAEGVAYKRIAVARAARRHPEILAALRNGEMHLTGACLIAPHLSHSVSSAANPEELEPLDVAGWIAMARHATTREIKQRIVDWKPKPSGRDFIRRLPRSGTAGLAEMGLAGGAQPATVRSGSASNRISSQPQPQSRRDPLAEVGGKRSDGSTRVGVCARGRCDPLGADRFAVRIVVDGHVHSEIQELRDLLRHSIPDGDVAKLMARAIGTLLKEIRTGTLGADVDRRKKPVRKSETGMDAFAIDGMFGPPSRHIPVAIRRAVWSRDGGRCAFVGDGGENCGDRGFLEFHHRVPWAHNREHTVDNIALRCRAHNQFEADLDFGRDVMDRHRGRN